MYSITFQLTLGLKQTSQAITADGSATTASRCNFCSDRNKCTSAGTHSCIIADGTEGQVKIIINTSTSGTNAVTITPTNFRGYSTIVLNAQGETATLMFKNSNWNVISHHGRYNIIMTIDKTILEAEREKLKTDFDNVTTSINSLEKNLITMRGNLNAFKRSNPTSR